MIEIDEAGRPHLAGGWSPTSGLSHFPRAEVCPYSGATDVEPVELPRTGTLWAWTAVTAAPPGYHGPIPYGFGVVELTDGLRVVTRLTVADPDALELGQPMELVTEELPTGPDGASQDSASQDSAAETTTIWAFAPQVTA